MMESYSSLAFAVLVAALVLVLTVDARGQAAQLDLQPQFVLGEDDDDPDVMFGDPVIVRHDNRGAIYVFDQLSMSVKVFDRDGRFVRKLGRRGNQPGAFHSFSTAHVSPEGDILVFDQMNRRGTWLGDDVRTFEVDPDAMLWPRDVLSYGSNYLLLYSLPGEPALVHEWEPSFSRPVRRFVDAADVVGPSDPFLDRLTALIGGRLDLWERRLLLAPPVCSRPLLQVDPSAASGRAVPLAGSAAVEGAVEPIAATDGGWPDDATVLHGPDGPLAARVHCWRAGSASLSGGHLAHFTVRRAGPGQALFAELFAPDGRLIGEHELAELAAPDHRRPAPTLSVFGGPDDRVYVVDRRGDVPVVRVYEVRLQQAP